MVLYFLKAIKTITQEVFVSRRRELQYSSPREISLMEQIFYDKILAKILFKVLEW